MPMPAPAVMGAAPAAGAAASAGSSFLTGPVGYGLGAAAGQIAGNMFGKGSVNFRGKYARNALAHQRKIWQAERDQIGPNMAEKMKALDAAGLHRLAALGITIPSSSQPNNQPMIPGQSPLGSAVSEGINTAMNVSQSREARANAQVLAGLQVEEQSLRNDWLRTQIARSKMAMMKDAANRTQDSPELADGPTGTKPGEMVFSEHQRMPTGTTTGSEAASDRYGEVVGEGQGIVNTGYDTAGVLLPKTFGDWWIDNVSNAKPHPHKTYPGDPGKGWVIVRKPVPRPKYPTRAHKSRRGRY